MSSAFQYVVQLGHIDKPNYELIKLWMAFDEEDEKKVFDTKLDVNNNRLAKDILYEHEEAKVANEPIIANSHTDLNEDYNFDQDTNEYNGY